MEQKMKLPKTAPIIQSKGRLTADEVYKGIINALMDNVGEINVVVDAKGKRHFTSCSITNIFDMLRECSEKLAESFNKEIGSNHAN
jgi:hypothetical protein